jgi:hypothetical protein
VWLYRVLMRRDKSLFPRTKVFITLLLASLVASAGINVLQARRIHLLVDPGKPVASLVGKPASPLAGFSLSGTPIELVATGQTTVLYYFSPTCAWCERNWANIDALIAGSNGRYRVVGVATGRGLADFVARRRLPFDVIEGLSDNTRQHYGFSGTPHTVVVSAEGLITHEWRGAFTPRIERQVEDLFGVLLPGVASGSSAAGSPPH